MLRQNFLPFFLSLHWHEISHIQFDYYAHFLSIPLLNWFYRICCVLFIVFSLLPHLQFFLAKRYLWLWEHQIPTFPFSPTTTTSETTFIAKDVKEISQLCIISQQIMFQSNLNLKTFVIVPKVTLFIFLEQKGAKNSANFFQCRGMKDFRFYGMVRKSFGKLYIWNPKWWLFLIVISKIF